MKKGQKGVTWKGHPRRPGETGYLVSSGVHTGRASSALICKKTLLCPHAPPPESQTSL